MGNLKFESSKFIWIVIALLLAIALRVWLEFVNAVPFNADEAVVGLMARHILQGERPIFFYGQAYMGSLDAYLIAIGFWLFGQQVWVMRLVQLMLYLATMITTAWLGKAIFKTWQAGAISALLLSIPTVNTTLYTTATLGGYGEALLIGNLILLTGVKINAHYQKGELPPLWLWTVEGFLVGLGLWAFGITLIYSIPVGIFLVWRSFTWLKRSFLGQRLNSLTRFGWHAFLPCAIGLLVGSAPWLGYASHNGFTRLVGELGGGAIAGVERLAWLSQVGQHLMNLFVLGLTVVFGLRPPWEVRWLGLPLLPFVLMFWLVVLWFSLKRLLREPLSSSPAWMLFGVGVALVAGFIFLPFGADPSGRYFVPLAVPLALFAAEFLFDLHGKIGRWTWGLLAIILIYNLWGTVQCALANPPGLTTQFNSITQVDHTYDARLMDFLRDRNEMYGYTDYWIGYPLAFLSQEEIIYVPRLPYHLDFRYTDRDDRYPPYDEAVKNVRRAAFITANHPELDNYLRNKFFNKGVDWQEKRIGDYVIFYNLTEKIGPQEIGLGVNNNP